MLFIFISSEPGVKFTLLVVAMSQRDWRSLLVSLTAAGQLILIVCLVFVDRSE